MPVSRRVLAAIGLGVLTMSSCDGQRKPIPASKKVKGGKRTDAAPLIERFPALGTPVSVAWYSGTVGSSDIGPSTYWIDAVVEVTVGTSARLAGLGTGSAATPKVVEDLQPEVPDGAFISSPELDAALHLDRWQVKAFLQEASNTVVISALGE